MDFFPIHPDDVEDHTHGTPQQEAQKEMVQIYGLEKHDHEWILSDYDVWEKNPYFTGVPTNIHPEDDFRWLLVDWQRLRLH